MAHGAVMFSNGYRTRQKTAAMKNNHQAAGRSLQRTAAQIHRAETQSMVPPLALIEGGFRRL
jgi:hypothetical protein